VSEIRYLIDENTSHAIADQLRRRDPTIEVLTVGHDPAPPCGTPDPDLLIWMEREGYCLVTRNRSSMPRHLRDHLAAGRHVPGIFILRPKATIGEVVDDLLLIAGASRPEEYQDQIGYIPL
jgi:hypothetical protein